MNRVKVELSPDESRLLVFVLELASEWTGHRFDCTLSDVFPELEKRRQFMKAYHEWNGDPDVFDEKVEDGDLFLDANMGAIAAYLVDRIKRPLKGEDNES